MTDPREEPPERSLEPSSVPAPSRRQYVKSVVLLAVTAVSLYLLLPGLISVFSSWRSLEHLDWPFAVLVLLFEVASSFCLWEVDRIALASKGWFPIACPIGWQRARPDRPRLGDPVHGGDAAEGGTGRWGGGRRLDRVDRAADLDRLGASRARDPGDDQWCAGRPRPRERCLPGRGSRRVAPRSRLRPFQDRRSARMDRSRRPTWPQHHASAPTPGNRTPG
jgi:hypothetical protein